MIESHDDGSNLLVDIIVGKRERSGNLSNRFFLILRYGRLIPPSQEMLALFLHIIKDSIARPIDRTLEKK